VTELVGKTLGHYKIVEQIGEGGMAVVYKAHQESLGRHVAIKVLRGELARDREFVARFRREALASARLSHPNILHVYDAGAAGGVYYIVMGYVDGGSLKDLIEAGPLDVDLATSIATQLADALDHAHRQGLVHRDVKPSNVLLNREKRPLLTDFGIAKVLYEATRLTRTGTSIGTPEYMAPEHALMQPTDARTDIYAMGIVLYEMLCGCVPFTAETPVVTLYRQVNEAPQPLRKMNARIPRWLEEIVAKALAKAPEARYQRASDLAEDLRQRRAPAAAVPAAAAAGASAPPATPPPAARTPAVQRPAVRAPATRAPVPAAAPTRPVGAAAPPHPGRREGRRRPVPILMGAIGLLLVVLIGGGAYFFGDVLGERGAVGAPPTARATASEEATTVATTPTDTTTTATLSPTASPTGSTTPTSTSSPTTTGTPTATPTGTQTGTATATPTGTATATRTPTRTVAATPTPRPSPTATTPPTQPPTNPPPTNPPPTNPPPTNPPPTNPPPTNPPPTNPPPTNPPATEPVRPPTPTPP
jgi:serine/threonine-protein kinase